MDMYKDNRNNIETYMEDTFQNRIGNFFLTISLLMVSFILAWFFYGMGGALIAESFNLYTNYDGEILFDDSAMMNWKQAFLIGMIYYILIMTFFYFLLKTMNLEGKQRNIQLTVLSVFNLLVCFGVGYILSTPFIS